MQIDDVLEWARDGKWAILESHPQVIEEAFEQLADLREQAGRPTTGAVDLGWTCGICHSSNLQSDLLCGFCNSPRPSH
jgi:hypothetical protein